MAADRPRRQLTGAPGDRPVARPTAARPADDRVAIVGPANSTTNARISECSVQAACGMSAGQTAASPAAIRVRSSPTPTQPPPSITMNQVVFGLACGSIRALRANASSDDRPAPVGVDDLAGQADRPDRPVRAPVADPEPADLDRHAVPRRPG